MRALDVLKGASEHVVRFSYSGKTWTGLRVAARRKGEPSKLEASRRSSRRAVEARGEPSKLEASRFAGVVGAIEQEVVQISTNEEIELADVSAPISQPSKPAKRAL